MSWYTLSQRNRGRWGNPQADESRNPLEQAQERFREFEEENGKHIRFLNDLFKQGNWEGFNTYVQKLLTDGFDSKRIDSIVSSSTRGKMPI